MSSIADRPDPDAPSKTLFPTVTAAATAADRLDPTPPRRPTDAWALPAAPQSPKGWACRFFFQEGFFYHIVFMRLFPPLGSTASLSPSLSSSLFSFLFAAGPSRSIFIYPLFCFEIIFPPEHILNFTTTQ